MAFCFQLLTLLIGAELLEAAWRALEEALEHCPEGLKPQFQASCAPFADRALQVISAPCNAIPLRPHSHRRM